MSIRAASAQRRRVLAALAAALVAPLARSEDASFEGIRYRVVGAEAPDSVRPVSRTLLELLARGDIEAAARLSNAPARRAEVLRDYLASVGDAEFRRIFERYAAAPISAELAVGERRLLIRDLPGADRNVAGQIFVRADGAFVLDDVPGSERARVQRLLRAYREGKLRPSAGTG